MNIKINQILLKEESFASGFSKIKVGDAFIVVTKDKNYHAEVIMAGTNEIGVTMDDKKYLITSNSLEGDELRSYEVIDTKRQGATILKDVKAIIIQRNGATITQLIPSGGRFDDNGEDAQNVQDKPRKPKKPVVKPFYKEAFYEVVRGLEGLKVDDKLIIKSGKLITNDEIGKETIITLEIHVRSVTDNDVILGAVTDIHGDKENKYGELMGQYVKISKSQGVELTENGVVLLLRAWKVKKDYYVDGVYEIGVGEYFSEPRVSTKALEADPGFKDLMLKNPGLGGKLLGQAAKGVLPALDIINKIKLGSSHFTTGNKPEFKYIGKELRPDEALTLRPNGVYVGLFKSSTTIKLTGSRRGESFTIKLKKKIDEDTYQVDISFTKIVNGKANTTKMGRAIIKILDPNYR